MATLNQMTCACCGTDITAPQFFNGKAYGWSCILKVNPKQKRIKDGGIWVKAKFAGERKAANGNNLVIVDVDGDRLSFYGIMIDGKPYGLTLRDFTGDYLRVSKSKANPKSIWKGYEIVNGEFVKK